MALGKAVIATPIGAEGIEHTEGLNILIARNATEFAAHIVALDEDPEYMLMLGNEARKLVENSYSDQRIVGDLVAFYQRLRST